MKKQEDFTGRTFGWLTVLEFAGKSERSQKLWRCRCTCGTVKVVVGASMKAGNVKSCGCKKAMCVRKHYHRRGNHYNGSAAILSPVSVYDFDELI